MASLKRIAGSVWAVVFGFAFPWAARADFTVVTPGKEIEKPTGAHVYEAAPDQEFASKHRLEVTKTQTDGAEEFEFWGSLHETVTPKTWWEVWDGPKFAQQDTGTRSTEHWLTKYANFEYKWGEQGTAYAWTFWRWSVPSLDWNLDYNPAYNGFQVESC